MAQFQPSSISSDEASAGLNLQGGDQAAKTQEASLLDRYAIEMFLIDALGYPWPRPSDPRFYRPPDARGEQERIEFLNWKDEVRQRSYKDATAIRGGLVGFGIAMVLFTRHGWVVVLAIGALLGCAKLYMEWRKSKARMVTAYARTFFISRKGVVVDMTKGA
jgi:hypothetical protein